MPTTDLGSLDLPSVSRVKSAGRPGCGITPGLSHDMDDTDPMGPHPGRDVSDVFDGAEGDAAQGPISQGTKLSEEFGPSRRGTVDTNGPTGSTLGP